MPPRALLFDFDGVIAETENIHIAAWQRTLADLGWDVPADVCARAVEIDDRAFLAEVFARQGITGGDLAGWVDRKQALTVALMADSPRTYPGVVELVHRLRSRVRLAVVTTTWRANVAAVLGAVGLAPDFELIVGKEDVSAVKPDPAGYLLALERLHLTPADAVALEDSPSGLTAARAAGLRCLAIGHRAPPGDWIGDAPYLPSLAETEQVLSTLGLS